MTFQELLDDERALGREEGIGIGREEGIGIGEQKKLIEMVQKKLARNKSIEQIAEELEEDVSIIAEIVREL